MKTRQKNNKEKNPKKNGGKRKLFVANWKMNPSTIKEAVLLFGGVKSVAKRENITAIICPPFPFISNLSEKKGDKVFVGAQNLSTEKEGAFTGEVSAQQLQSVGVNFCIVGHSERRKMGETDEMVSKKIQLLLQKNINPILCVGEKERDSEGNFFNNIKEQLLQSLASTPKNFASKLIIAYEPLWAISTAGNGAMQAHEIHETVIFLRKVLSDKFGTKIAEKIKILYGGSVDALNVGETLREGNCDGVLVGKASLKIASFSEIAKALSSSK